MKLKQLMVEFDLGSEAEMFVSDLSFKIFDNDKNNTHRSGIYTKNEDVFDML